MPVHDAVQLDLVLLIVDHRKRLAKMMQTCQTCSIKIVNVNEHVINLQHGRQFHVSRKTRLAMYTPFMINFSPAVIQRYLLIMLAKLQKSFKHSVETRFYYSAN